VFLPLNFIFDVVFFDKVGKFVISAVVWAGELPF
jgi:hypothetical protein